MSDEELLKEAQGQYQASYDTPEPLSAEAKVQRSIAASLLVIARNSIKPDAELVLKNFGQADGSYTITPKTIDTDVNQII